MKQKTLPNGPQETVWMPCSLHGAKGLKLPWMPSWAFQFANMYYEGTQSLWEAVSMMLCMDGQ